MLPVLPFLVKMVTVTVVSSKTAAVAGTVVGTALAVNRVTNSKKQAAERSRYELQKALAEAYAQGRADGQREVAEEFRNMAFAEGRRDAMQGKSLGDGTKGVSV